MSKYPSNRNALLTVLLRCVAQLSRRPYAVEELSAILSISRRTAYRYLDAMEAAGLNIVRERDGQRVLISLSRPTILRWLGDAARATQKEAYEERKRLGLCALCGERPPSSGVICPDCRARQKPIRDRARRKAYTRAITTSMCVAGCGRPAVRGVRCAECAVKSIASMLRGYAALKAAGLCVRCRDRAAAPGRTLCKEHLEDARRRAQDKRPKPT